MRDTFTTSILGACGALLLSHALSGCGSGKPPYQRPAPQYASCTANAHQPTLCSVGAAGCPLEADTAIACAADTNEVIIRTAPGAQTTEHLLVRSHDTLAVGSGFGTFRVQLFTVNGDAVNDAQSDLIPVDDESFLDEQGIGVFSDASGAPRVMRLAHRQLDFYAPDAQGIFVPDAMPLKTTSDGADHATMGADGTFAASVGIAEQSYLAVRAPAGSWTTMPTTLAIEQMVLDLENRLYQASLGSQEFFYRIGNAAQSTRVPIRIGASSLEPIQMAVAGPSLPTPSPPVLSFLSRDAYGLDVMVPNSLQAYVDLTTGGYTRTCNPPNPGPSQCTTAVCNDLGESPVTHALTRAEDGTVWLAYLSKAVDRGVTLRVATFFFDYCETDRFSPHPGDGALQLVLSRIVPGNPPKIEERYRAPVAASDPMSQPNSFTNFSSRGSELHLVIPTGKNQLRRLVLDTRRL